MSTGHFELLGLEPRYAIDRADLESRYRERSKQVHPDRFATAPAAERVRALQDSMALNEAYKTLRKPVSRAEYLLELHGLSIGTNEQLEPGFLMEVLEAREELAEAKAAGDEDKLERLESAMQDRYDASVAKLAAEFSAFEGGDKSALERIKRELILIRYVDRYLEQFDDPDDA